MASLTRNSRRNMTLRVCFASRLLATLRSTPLVSAALISTALISTATVAVAAPVVLVPTPLTASAKVENSEPEQDWFQFDILLFSQKNLSSEKEQPPALSDHSFPPDTITLYTQEQLTIPKELLPQPKRISRDLAKDNAQTPGSTAQVNAIPGDLLGSPLITDRSDGNPFSSSAEFALEDQQHAVPLTEYNSVKQPKLTDRIPNLEQDAFILLPESLSGLRNQARSLQRGRDYKVLWQASVRMPLDRDGDAVPVRVEVGPKLGNNHEIEGVISLSQKRFLHAEANLWINTLNPVASLDMVLAGAPLLAPLPNGHPLPLKPDAPLTASPHQQLPTRPINLPFYTANMPVYSSKRLQPGRLNYIDHPDVGLLIHVTSYQRPELPEDESESNTVDASK